MLYIIIMFTGVICGRILNDAFFDHRTERFISILNGILWSMLIHIRGMHFETLLYCLTASILLIISVHDIQYYRIPVIYNRILFCLGIIHLCLNFTNMMHYIWGALGMTAFLVFIAMIGKENLLGGGDIRMMAAAGLLLGWPQVFMAFYIACVLALMFHGTKIVLKRASHEIAMGPYLASGILILML